MKTLKIEDDTNGVLEISTDNILVENGQDIPAVLIACKWDGQEAFVNISDIYDLDEVIRWLCSIRKNMIGFNKQNQTL